METEATQVAIDFSNKSIKDDDDNNNNDKDFKSSDDEIRGTKMTAPRDDDDHAGVKSQKTPGDDEDEEKINAGEIRNSKGRHRRRKPIHPRHVALLQIDGRRATHSATHQRTVTAIREFVNRRTKKTADHSPDASTSPLPFGSLFQRLESSVSSPLPTTSSASPPAPLPDASASLLYASASLPAPTPVDSASPPASPSSSAPKGENGDSVDEGSQERAQSSSTTRSSTTSFSTVSSSIIISKIASSSSSSFSSSSLHPPSSSTPPTQSLLLRPFSSSLHPPPPLPSPSPPTSTFSPPTPSTTASAVARPKTSSSSKSETFVDRLIVQRLQRAMRRGSIKTTTTTTTTTKVSNLRPPLPPMIKDSRRDSADRHPAPDETRRKWRKRKDRKRSEGRETTTTTTTTTAISSSISSSSSTSTASSISSIKSMGSSTLSPNSGSFWRTFPTPAPPTFAHSFRRFSLPLPPTLAPPTQGPPTQAPSTLAPLDLSPRAVQRAPAESTASFGAGVFGLVFPSKSEFLVPSPTPSLSPVHSNSLSPPAISGGERWPFCSSLKRPAEDFALDLSDRGASKRRRDETILEKTNDNSEEPKRNGKVFPSVPSPSLHHNSSSSSPPSFLPTSSSSSPSPSSSARKNYKSLSRVRRVEANARERTRVHTIGAAFDALRNAVPSYSCNQKLSKLAILRVASAYIMTLAKMLDRDYSAEQDDPSVAECVEFVTRTIQTEGRVRRKGGVEGGGEGVGEEGEVGEGEEKE